MVETDRFFNIVRIGLIENICYEIHFIFRDSCHEQEWHSYPKLPKRKLVTLSYFFTSVFMKPRNFTLVANNHHQDVIIWGLSSARAQLAYLHVRDARQKHV